MAQVSKHPLSPQIEKRVYEIFIDSIKNTKSSDEVVHFLNDLLSQVEKVMLAKRVAIAFLLIKGAYTYEQISRTIKVSYGTIAKVHAVLALQGEGYRKIIIDMLKKEALKMALAELTEVLTILPPKGANWSRWKKEKLKKELERRKPL